MNKKFRLALGAIFFLTSSLALACDYPDRPRIPDGDSASKEDMLAAKSDVQTFLADVDEYLRCVEADEQAAIESLENPDAEALRERELALNRKFDAANEEKALVGEQFNQQVRAYNAKRKQQHAKGASEPQQANESSETGNAHQSPKT